jgi:hypothetical protein
MDPSRWPRGTFYPQKLVITSPTSGGRSVGIVRSRTQTMEFLLLQVTVFLAQQNQRRGRKPAPPGKSSSLHVPGSFHGHSLALSADDSVALSLSSGCFKESDQPHSSSGSAKWDTVTWSLQRNCCITYSGNSATQWPWSRAVLSSAPFQFPLDVGNDTQCSRYTTALSTFPTAAPVFNFL